ncbi:assimilatory sulfite reductase (NADPH) [Malassezia cuniculi]|uniref:assimilatory sulfite reductase (NADPH) n=1 Tax=Malassezia cuniculi TaxID=948313 RepID=A0AAF0EVQ5_9BASI|nr:assimilatory sulfite reductase (NADPH) [Malassezia cuniculi]
MAKTQPTPLQSVALIAAGAAAGVGAWTLVKQFTGSSSAPRKSEAVAEAPVAEEAPKAVPAAKLAEVIESSGFDPIDCGVLGVPRPDIPAPPAADMTATHMDFDSEASAAATLLSTEGLTSSTAVIEKLAHERSSLIFAYESAAAGFGSYVEALEASAKASGKRTGAKVYSMQARAGAGAAIAGFLAGEGSASPATGEYVSVLVNAASFQAIAPALVSIEGARRDELVVHVSAATQLDDLTVANDYAAVLAAAELLGQQGFSVVFSSGRQEAIDTAHYLYSRKSKTPVVHVFDGAFAGRELGFFDVPTAKTAAREPAPFAYTGPSSPETVLVVPNSPLALKLRALLVTLSPEVRRKIAVVSVRTLYPWKPEELAKVLPKSVTSLRVIEQSYSSSGAVYGEVLVSALGGELGAARPVHSVTLAAGDSLSASEAGKLLALSAESSGPISTAELHSVATPERAINLLELSSTQVVTFVGADSGNSVAAAELFGQALHASSKSTSVRILARYDNYAAGGAVRADVVFTDRTESDIPVDLLAGAAASHVVVVSEPSTIVPAFEVFGAVRKDGAVLIDAPGWTSEDVESGLRAADKHIIAERGVAVSLVDSARIAESGDSKQSEGDAAAAALAAAAAAAAGSLKRVASAPQLKGVAGEAQKLAAVSTSSWSSAKDEEEVKRGTLGYNALAPSRASTDSERGIVRATWAQAAWQYLFREAYALDDRALRPDLPEKTWNVEVSVHRRLTPLDYDRNVFHMELSTKGTDLKYEVGEALGVHGWNDEKEVSDFIKWSGYNPDEVVSAPSVTHPGHYETRTVFQLLQQNLDVFGKPPKSFFEELGKVVTSPDEARWLRFVSSAEGNSTFKKYSELETVTYVDVLHMFPSARVSVDWLIRNVELIKPRHYSIASAQAFVGESVHLLIVSVDWKTPSGQTRYGQCTRYLSEIKPGTKVTVSLKPSVMKLPPLDTQPIIMAGLGTGAAPFRAFIQARALKKAQGVEVGPLLYYFGSRYRSAEYLYGEELEAYLHDGVLERMGLAFSRDTSKKVYIQHKIKEDGDMLTAFLSPELANAGRTTADVTAALADNADEGKKGIFTLCGPVWPVPDIHEALVSAFVARGLTHEQAEERMEQLKEEERYVLEVY